MSWFDFLLSGACDIDSLNNRDEPLIEKVTQLMERPLSAYHRSRVTGLDHVPEGPCLYVGNHKAGICVTSDVPEASDISQKTGCSPGHACDVMGGGLACLPTGTTPLGGACVFTDACVPGTLCVAGTCRRVCRKSDSGLEQYRCSAHCPDTVEILAPAEWDTGVCP